jgi:photosystem II stability/assembly factor-like uncharacterized protein
MLSSFRALKSPKKLLAALLFLTALTVWAGEHRRRWIIYLHLAGVAKTHSLVPDQAGYEIELLPFNFAASFADRHHVYLIDTKGRVYQSDDQTAPAAARLLGNAEVSPRMIFVSARGTIFVSGDNFPLLRSIDHGKTWGRSHELSVWRMTEDRANHTIYAGVYTRKQRPRYIAKLLKSADEGETWEIIFQNDRLDHIHSVRWDPKYRRLYLSAGDGAHRGQAYSEDAGKTWRWINAGGKQGHTDVAISENNVFWGSDDNLGRILRAPRDPVRDGATILWASDHHVWWVIAEGRQLYAGTLTGERIKNTGAYLLASADEGNTWQKLLEDSDGGAPRGAFLAESRQLSAAGWLYCSTISGKSYRVRRMPKV